ncbi:MAG: Tfp pilus assembly protein FimT/FimU, partial [Gammaproteobacteria bacterium]
TWQVLAMKRPHAALAGRQGFTLVELMTVLAIAGILLALATPDLRRMVRQQELKATVADLYSALELTRAQAIGRASRVLLVPANGSDWD